MRKLLFAMAMSMGAAACAEVVNDPPPELEGMPPMPTRDEVNDIQGPQLAAEPEPSQCDMLPADDTACAYACDSIALQEFIPPGTCVIFSCPLDDGTTVRVGGCRP